MNTNSVIVGQINSVMCARNFSLRKWQQHNDSIYGVANQNMFSPMRMTMRIGRFAGRLHKAIECGNKRDIQHHSVMAFSWLLGLTNQPGDLVLAEELLKKFPKTCPHCHQGPCACFGENEILVSTPADPVTLDDFQAMFAWLYPRNKLNIEQGKIVEEVFELQEALDNYTGTKEKELRPAVISEICDVGAHLLAIANCTPFKMSEGMADYFAEGCCMCHRSQCCCPFPATVTVSPRKPVGS